MSIFERIWMDSEDEARECARKKVDYAKYEADVEKFHKDWKEMYAVVRELVTPEMVEKMRELSRRYVDLSNRVLHVKNGAQGNPEEEKELERMLKMVEPGLGRVMFKLQWLEVLDERYGD
jgi:hypothetical protein